ncbi:MAG: bifunctional protein FolD [Patescibacteria group bacterium]|nr:MAG: bifunctional protein FolD [Patescibacteria group bacterium]
MTYFFDGKMAASLRKLRLRYKAGILRRRRVLPTLASILVSPDKNNLFYTSLKEKFANDIGCQLVVFEFGEEATKEDIISAIDNLNSRKDIHGIMIQLPLPKRFSILDREELIGRIIERKDVDGLKEKSLYVAPVVQAVIYAIDEAKKMDFNIVRPSAKIVVVGASGFEGRKIVEALNNLSYQVIEVDREINNLAEITREADILISVTGNPGLIKPDYVKEGAVLIDLGYPKGDIEKSAYQKASFVSPVPGGVGPMTISFLMENLIKAARSQLYLDKLSLN